MAMESPQTSSFPGNRLPSKARFSVFLFHHKIQKEVLFCCSSFYAEEELEVLANVANIPGRRMCPWVRRRSQTVTRSYGALAKIQVTETETEEGNEEMHLRVQPPRRHCRNSRHSKAMERDTDHLEEDKAFIEGSEGCRPQSCSRLAWTRS
ncbi:hypothetical protein GWK47_017474 [Chionoecetes opilio]|uniref:Uncharacterized protein n=1 Tax=Chionoecetes opilio TaxID=41210 RepID=A0A8J4XRT2_CHIOP|nr:hypothetical protein GWK47_017474 [Chionoecetes opilio]